MNITNNITEGIEITYSEAAEIIDVSPRAVRDVLKKYRHVCPPINYSYRKVRFPFAGVIAVKAARRSASLKTATPNNVAKKAKVGK